jgi:hypothetical protein
MTVRRGTLHTICVLCGILAVVTPGLAQLPPSAASIALTWQAPDGCPAQADVLSALGSATDAVFQPGTGPGLDVRVVVEQIGLHWQAHLHISGALEAERTLEGDSCQALTEASVWLVVQALRSLRAPGGDDSADKPLEAESQPAANATPAPAPANLEPRSRLEDQPLIAAGAGSFELALAAWWDSGALPGPTVALGLEVAFNLRNWRFALRPRVFIPRSTALEGPGLTAASASVWLVELPVQACYGLPLGELKIGPCASLIAGLMGASSQEVPGARTPVGTWLALEGALAAVWRVTGRMALRGELALARPVRAPSFVVDDRREVHRTDRVLVRAGLTLGAHF